MAPKKKGGKSKAKVGAKKSGGGRGHVLDGVPMKTMTRDQLEGHVLRLKKEIDREREERGSVQRELERVQRLWTVKSSECDEAETTLRVKDSEMSKAEYEVLQEKRLSRQQCKSVIEECESNIGKLQIQNQETLKGLHEEYLGEKEVLEEERNELQDQLRQDKASFLSILAQVKLSHSREMEELRTKFEAETRQMELQNKLQLQRVCEELELRRKNEVARLQEGKNESLSRITDCHRDQMENIRKESTEVTTSNFRLIKQLTTQLSEKKNEMLRQSLSQSKEEKEKKQFEKEFEDTKKDLKDTKRELERLKTMEKRLKTSEVSVKLLKKRKEELVLELESLKKNANSVEQERNELYTNFVSVVTDVHQRSQMKTMLLEKKLTELTFQLEKKDSVLSEVFKTADLDPKNYAILTSKFEAIMDEKNQVIQTLREEVASIRRIYAELITKTSSEAKITPGY